MSVFYPSNLEVELADYKQLGEWFHSLPINTLDQYEIMSRIIERFRSLEGILK